MTPGNHQAAAEAEVAAKGEYERLLAQARSAATSGSPKAAVKLAKKAIKLEPEDHLAHMPSPSPT